MWFPLFWITDQLVLSCPSSLGKSRSDFLTLAARGHGAVGHNIHRKSVLLYLVGWALWKMMEFVRWDHKNSPLCFFCKDLFQITHLLVTFDVCFSLTIILGMVHPRLKLLRNKFQGSTTPEIMVQLLLPDGHVEKNPYDIPAFRKKPWKAEKSMSLCISEKRVFFWHTVLTGA